MNQKFKKGDKVICLDDNFTYVEGRGQTLKKDHEYTIDSQTFMGYVWLEGINAPYVPERFALK